MAIFGYLCGRGVGTGSSTEGLLADLWEYDIRKRQWRHVSGATTIGATASGDAYANSLNVDKAIGAREMAGIWFSHMSGDIYIYGGFGLKTTATELYLNDLWRFNIFTRKWTMVSGGTDLKTVYAPTPTPGGRRSFAFWGNKVLYIAGGKGYGTADATNLHNLDDMFSFDSQVNCATNCMFGSCPGDAGGATCTCFTGFSPANTCNIYTPTVTCVNGHVPFGTSECICNGLYTGAQCDIAIQYGWQMLDGTFGNSLGTSIQDQVSVTGAGITPSTVKSVPPSRDSMTSALDISTKITYFFGGKGAENSQTMKLSYQRYHNFNNDVWSYRNGEFKRHTLSTTNGNLNTPPGDFTDPSNAPAPRAGSCSFVYNSIFFIFGGHSDNDGEFYVCKFVEYEKFIISNLRIQAFSTICGFLSPMWAQMENGERLKRIPMTSTFST